MKFFEQFRKKNEGSSNLQEGVPSEWKMDDIPFRGAEQAREITTEPEPDLRQQRKILGCFIAGNSMPLGKSDVRLEDTDIEGVYQRIARGEIGRAEEKSILRDIKAPKHKYRPEALLAGVTIREDGRTERIPGIGNDKHMRRIIATATGVGFENPDKVMARDVATFFAKYETPADFEEDSQAFLENIRRANSAQKYNEYASSMRQFKSVMFGKQQEYWEQMKLVRKDAERFSRQTLEGDLDLSEKEPVVKAVTVAEASRAQVKQGVRNLESFNEDGSSQDKALVMREQGLFGVFDGVGGEKGGRLASNTAAAEVERRGMSEIRSSLDLCAMLDAASGAISRTPEAGASTGVLAKIKEIDGQKALMWASVGDSRIYVVNERGAAQITKDEGFENKITNALGGRGPEKRARQAGTVYLDKGDRVVLCSDGITGDKGADLMNNNELWQIVHGARSSEEAARGLILNARKTDDRTAIVVQI